MAMLRPESNAYRGTNIDASGVLNSVRRSALPYPAVRVVLACPPGDHFYRLGNSQDTEKTEPKLPDHGLLIALGVLGGAASDVGKESLELTLAHPNSAILD